MSVNALTILVSPAKLRHENIRSAVNEASAVPELPRAPVLSENRNQDKRLTLIAGTGRAPPYVK